MISMKKLTLLFALLFSGWPLQSLSAATTQASLVAEHNAIVPGQSFTIGLKLKMAPQWHTYWKNPGDSGLPTKIKWTLPEGFVAGEIQWPAPLYLEDAGIVSFAYEHEVLLITEITAPATLPLEQRITLLAKASWLECKESCLPGKADLEITLPVASSTTSQPTTSRSANTLRRNRRVRYQSPPPGSGVPVEGMREGSR